MPDDQPSTQDLPPFQLDPAAQIAAHTQIRAHPAPESVPRTTKKPAGAARRKGTPVKYVGANVPMPGQHATGGDAPRAGNPLGEVPALQNGNSTPKDGTKSRKPRKSDEAPNGKSRKKNARKSVEAPAPKKELKPRQVEPVKVLYPTVEEMDNIPFMIHKWHRLALEYGAIQLIPPKEWNHPPCRLLPSNKFYTREQVAPIAPFNGPVTILDEFETSKKKITLKKFKEYAAKTQAKLGFEDVPTTFGEEISDEALVVLKRNEARFFDMLRNGLGAEEKDVKLLYGVDVEAEGAYDPSTRCYDEYTVDGDDCLVHPENREQVTTEEEEEEEEQMSDMAKEMMVIEDMEKERKAAAVKPKNEALLVDGKKTGNDEIQTCAAKLNTSVVDEKNANESKGAASSKEDKQPSTVKGNPSDKENKQSSASKENGPSDGKQVDASKKCEFPPKQQTATDEVQSSVLKESTSGEEEKQSSVSKGNTSEEGEVKLSDREHKHEPREEGQISESDSVRAKINLARSAGETVPTANTPKTNNESLNAQPSAARFAFRSKPAPPKPAPTPQPPQPAPTPTASTQSAALPMMANPPMPAFPGAPLAGLQHVPPQLTDNVARKAASPRSRGTRRLAVQPSGAGSEITPAEGNDPPNSVVSASEDVPNTAVTNAAVQKEDEASESAEKEKAPPMTTEEVLDGDHQVKEKKLPLTEEEELDGSNNPVPMEVVKPEETSSPAPKESEAAAVEKPQANLMNRPATEEDVLDEGNGNEKALTVASAPFKESPAQVPMNLSGDKSVVSPVAKPVAVSNGTPSSVKSRKRPRRTNPVSHVGNVNDHGVLRHSPASPGINRPMFYVGASGTKFCFHTEDMFLNSISYMHEHSAVKVWYVIPSSEAELVEQYAGDKVFAKKCFEKDSLNKLLAAKTTMMDPFDMAKYGISVYRVCQTPGTFVITAPQGYHGGFNSGFNVAEAVNFANPDWLVFGRAAAELYAKERRESVVPYEYAVFHEARGLCKKAEEVGVKKLKDDPVIRTYARLVAEELKHFAVDMEDTIRKYAIEARVYLANIHDLEQRFALPSLHPSFGNGAGLICSVCNYKSHFYASTCATCEDKLRAKCVKCFRKGSRVCPKKGHKVVITRRHPPLLLLDMLNKLESIAGISVSAEERMRRVENITENWRLPKPKGNDPRLMCKLKLSRSIVPPEASLVHPPYAQDLTRKRKYNEKKRKKFIKVAGSESENYNEDEFFEQRKKPRLVKEEDEDEEDVSDEDYTPGEARKARTPTAKARRVRPVKVDGNGIVDSGGKKKKSSNERVISPERTKKRTKKSDAEDEFDGSARKKPRVEDRMESQTANQGTERVGKRTRKPNSRYCDYDGNP